MSEGDQQGNYVALLGNLLFPLIAFAGLFLLFRRAGDGSVSAARAAPATHAPSCSSPPLSAAPPSPSLPHPASRLSPAP